MSSECLVHSDYKYIVISIPDIIITFYYIENQNRVNKIEGKSLIIVDCDFAIGFWKYYTLAALVRNHLHPNTTK